MRYVTGDNAPGYLPEVEPRGPWNSWADAVRDLASLIEDDADQRLDETGTEGGTPDIQAALDEAMGEVESLRAAEDPRGCDVLFMGRAFFIRPAEDAE